MEIPGIEDDYYNDVMSWSSNDLIALVLANCLFVLNNKTGSIEKLYEAYDCEEITSLSWNLEGN